MPDTQKNNTKSIPKQSKTQFPSFYNPSQSIRYQKENPSSSSHVVHLVLEGNTNRPRTMHDHHVHTPPSIKPHILRAHLHAPQ
jgi:hypothetical protein